MARPKKYQIDVNEERKPSDHRESNLESNGFPFSTPPLLGTVPVAPIGAEDLIEEITTNPYELHSMESKIFQLCKESACSMKELSTLLDLPTKLLEEEFAEAIEKGLTVCKVLLRRTQMRSARVGDAKMMTFLGKNILGQEEKVEGTQGNVTIVISTGVPRTTADVVLANGERKKLT